VRTFFCLKKRKLIIGKRRTAKKILFLVGRNKGKPLGPEQNPLVYLKFSESLSKFLTPNN